MNFIDLGEKKKNSNKIWSNVDELKWRCVDDFFCRCAKCSIRKNNKPKLIKPEMWVRMEQFGWLLLVFAKFPYYYNYKCSLRLFCLFACLTNRVSVFNDSELNVIWFWKRELMWSMSLMCHLFGRSSRNGNEKESYPIIAVLIIYKKILINVSDFIKPYENSIWILFFMQYRPQWITDQTRFKLWQHSSSICRRDLPETKTKMKIINS